MSNYKCGEPFESRKPTRAEPDAAPPASRDVVEVPRMVSYDAVRQIVNKHLRMTGASGDTMLRELRQLIPGDRTLAAGLPSVSGDDDDEREAYAWQTA